MLKHVHVHACFCCARTPCLLPAHARTHPGERFRRPHRMYYIHHLSTAAAPQHDRNYMAFTLDYPDAGKPSLGVTIHPLSQCYCRYMVIIHHLHVITLAAHHTSHARSLYAINASSRCRLSRTRAPALTTTTPCKRSGRRAPRKAHSVVRSRSPHHLPSPHFSVSADCAAGQPEGTDVRPAGEVGGEAERDSSVRAGRRF